MMDVFAMSAPVTRGEFQEAIALLATKRELQEAVAPLATKVELQEAIALLATKVELQEAIAPLATKVELQEAIAKAVAPLATKVELELWGGALMARMDAQSEMLRREMTVMRRELQTDFARHANAIFESAQAMIRVLDDKYADLPRRVSAIEARLLDVERR